jgi:nucleoid DNA-binding protein
MIDGKFISTIQHLLTQEHCVIVPNLGAFVLRDNDATMNFFTKEIKPHHSNVYFNKGIIQDDGLFTNALKEALGLSYKETNEYIQTVISLIKSKVAEKKICSFSPIGNFFINSENEIFFIGNNQLNLNIETFGLKPIKWNIQNQNQFVPEIKILDSNSILSNNLNDAVILEVSASEQENTELHIRKNAFWNIAANVALITLSVGVLYLNSLAIKSVFTSKAKSQASSIQVIKITESKPKEDEESFMMVIGGKVVAIDKNGIQSQAKKYSTSKNISLSLNEIRNEIANSKGKYFVVGGSYITEAAAKMECQKWSQLNYKSTFMKVKGSSLIKIVLKRFVSGKDASNFAISVKTLPTNTISVQELNIAK